MKYKKEALWLLIPLLFSILCYQLVFDFRDPVIDFPSLYFYVETWIGFLELTLLLYTVFYGYRMVRLKYENQFSTTVFLITNALSILSFLYLARFFYFYNQSYIHMPEDTHSQIKNANTATAFWTIALIAIGLFLMELFVAIKIYKKHKA
ncbi:hypothetical protein [Flavobacterium sp. GCM10023249]|uniref:hypothetical protein n=1 Tax=unclassified Flavobacterium TaxID=196869 RepID=UPI00360A012D